MRLSGKSFAVLAALVPLPATATDIRGNITCSFEDANAVLSLRAMFSYRDDKPIFAIRGKLDVKPAGGQIAQQSHKLDSENLIQQWFYDSDLKFRFYVPLPDGSVQLAIQTAQVGDSQTYKGTYDLEISAPDASTESIGRDGNVICKTD